MGTAMGISTSTRRRRSARAKKVSQNAQAPTPARLRWQLSGDENFSLRRNQRKLLAELPIRASGILLQETLNACTDPRPRLGRLSRRRPSFPARIFGARQRGPGAGWVAREGRAQVEAQEQEEEQEDEDLLQEAQEEQEADRERDTRRRDRPCLARGA